MRIFRIVGRLKERASFGNVLLEANRQGVLSWHRTLRRYLDLLVQAQVLRVREQDVHSVNPQQLYTVISLSGHLWTGLTALRLHGLNWETPNTQLYEITTDLEAVVRAKPYTIKGKTGLVVGLEDALVYELKRDASEHTGATELVAAMLATRTLDLPYLLRRADRHDTGQTIRLLIKRLIDTFSSLPGEAEGRVFLEARTRFLKTLRDYNSRGILKLVETTGKGREGLATVQGLSPEQIVSVTGKQLGVSG